MHHAAYFFHGLEERTYFFIVDMHDTSMDVTVIEYSVLVPGIGASVEVLGYSQTSLALLSNAFQIFAYLILNLFTTKAHVTWRHYTAIALILTAIVLVV